MKHCFYCGKTLTTLPRVSDWTERYRCDRCKLGFVLSLTGKCVFVSKNKAEEFTLEDFDFGLGDKDGPIDLGFE